MKSFISSAGSPKKFSAPCVRNWSNERWIAPIDSFETLPYVTVARDESPVWSSIASEPASPLADTFTSASPPVMHNASAGHRESPVTPSKRSLTP